MSLSQQDQNAFQGGKEVLVESVCSMMKYQHLLKDMGRFIHVNAEELLNKEQSLLSLVGRL